MSDQFRRTSGAGGGTVHAHDSTYVPLKPSYTLATRPAPGAVPAGTIVFVSDLNGGTAQKSTGAAWVSVAPGLTEAPAAHRTTHMPGGSDSWTAHTYKAADESVTSSAVLQDDNHLFFSVAAAEVWRFFLALHYEGAITGDISYGWTFPTASAGRFAHHSLQNGATTNSDTIITKSTALANTLSGGAAGAGVPVSLLAWGLLRVGGTGGTFRLQWAQRVSDGTATTVYADSELYAVRVA